MMKNTSEKIKDEILNNTPLKKAASPEDVANAALFLSSNSSNHITVKQYL